MAKEKDKVYRPGRAAKYMKVIGKMINLMGMVDKCMLMGNCMRGNGSMARLMAMVFLLMLMDPLIRGSGRMTSSMDMALKSIIIYISIIFI